MVELSSWGYAVLNDVIEGADSGSSLIPFHLFITLLE